MPFPPDVCDPIPPEHKAGPPPNCEIRLDLVCDAGDCPEGQITVELIEATTQKVLAKGPVNCTGDCVRHVFPMTESRPEQATKLVARFRCGARQHETPLGVLLVKCG
jgi:hypothetical protein